MKVLLLNGSARAEGNTARLLREVERVLHREGLESELLQIGGDPVRDCISCSRCEKNNRCVFGDDVVNTLLEKAEGSDAFLFGTPVYYAHAAGRLLSVLDRAFYAGEDVFRHKPGAAVAVARRAGTTSALEDIDRYFTIAEMPVVSSTYWNVGYGARPGEAVQDAEGLQTMRNLAWLLRCIEAGREKGVVPPENEAVARTNFIR